jgi:hypothetical protein
MNETIRQRSGLHSFIERRSTPAVPRERDIVIRPNDETMRGYADAGMPMTIPRSDNPDYLQGFSNRKQELDCCASVSP